MSTFLEHLFTAQTRLAGGEVLRKLIDHAITPFGSFKFGADIGADLPVQFNKGGIDGLIGMLARRVDQLHHLGAYLKKHLRANPDPKHADLKSRLQYAMSAHRKGVRCACGAPIWIIGSAEAGLGCFSCITGDVDSDGDYEISGFD